MGNLQDNLLNCKCFDDTCIKYVCTCKCSECYDSCSCDMNTLQSCILNPFFAEENQKDQLTLLLNEFDFLSEIPHPIFGNLSVQRQGNVKLFSHQQTKEKIVMKFVETTSHRESLKLQEEYQQRMRLQNPNTIQLRQQVTRKVDSLCTIYYKTFLFFDYVSSEIAEELAQRIAKQQFLQESQIWTFIEGAINAMEYFQTNNINHQCLTQNSIYLTPSGAIKICDPAILSYESNYKQILRDPEDPPYGIYLSPQQMIGIQNEEKIPQHDKTKTDVYTLGMILLQIASLMSSDHLYDYSRGIINSDKIRDRLVVIKAQYHDSLMYLLKDMLEEDEKNRPDFKQLKNKLSTNLRVTQLSENLAVSKPGAPPRQQDQTINQPNLAVTSPFDNQFPAVSQVIGNNFLDQTGFVTGAQNIPSFVHAGLSFDKNYGVESVSERYNNGCRYEGEKRNGLKHGKGKFFYKNSGHYDGQWKDDKMDGLGTLYFASGKTAYDGHWRQDRFHGTGTLYNDQPESTNTPVDHRDFSNLGSKWVKYEGSFSNDQKEGFGKYFFTNGDYFFGGFKADMVHGQGSFFSQGKETKGRWQFNKFG